MRKYPPFATELAAGGPPALAGVEPGTTEEQLRALLREKDRLLQKTRARLRRVESRLRESEERLELVADTMREVLWVCDSTLSRVLYVSPAYESTFGRPAAELYNDITSFLSAVHPNDRERVLAWALRLRRGRAAEIECRIVRPDGSFRWIRARPPLLDAEGATGRAVGVAEDITERKRTEEVVRFLGEANRLLTAPLGREETLRRIAELCVPQLADWCAVDLLEEETMRRVAIGRRGSGSADAPEVTVGGAPVSPECEVTAGAITRVLRTGRPELSVDLPECLVPGGSGSEQLGLFAGMDTCSSMIVPMAARGRVFGSIMLVTAESGRRYGDRDLALAGELADRAAIAIDNARLYEQALVANRAKSDFLAVVSHELRTPLNAIAGYTDLLDLRVKGPLTVGQQAHLRGIQSNTRHLIQVIDQILTFSRLEVGEEQLRLEPVDLCALAGEVASTGEPLAEAKGLRFAVRVPRHRIELRTDRGKLTQVLLNLVTNAVKFTERGRIELSVRRAGRAVVLRVRDTGIGIPPEQLDHIFEPFWQAEQPPTRRAGGTGLGLSVTHRLVRLLGGRIAVESDEGAGTCFTVRLPSAPLAATAGARRRHET